MNLLDPKILGYLDQISTAESPILQQLDRETHLKVNMPQMISGHQQGLFLRFVVAMAQPKRVLEIGTFTGYSGLCIASALPTDGLLFSIEINPEREAMITRYWQEAGVWDKTKLLIGNALELIPTLKEEWDLVFIDADKINYANYYDLVFSNLKMGGFIIADNVLWSGKVVDESVNDKDTKAIRAFNEKVSGDSRMEKMILPLRDGLMIARKIAD